MRVKFGFSAATSNQLGAFRLNSAKASSFPNPYPWKESLRGSPWPLCRESSSSKRLAPLHSSLPFVESNASMPRLLTLGLAERKISPKD